MYCNPQESSVHEVLQARILEWVIILFSSRSSLPREWTSICCMAGRFFTTEPPGKLHSLIEHKFITLQCLWVRTPSASRSFTRLRSYPWLWSHLQFQLWKRQLPTVPMQLLTGFNSLRIVGLRISAAVSWRPPSIPCRVDLSNIVTYFIEVGKQKINKKILLSRFRKGRGTRYQIANICWIIEKAREFQKNIYIFFIDYAKAFDCVAHSKLWKILKKMAIPDYTPCLLRNLYAGQEATVKTRHATVDCFQSRKGVCQGCILLHWLFNLHAEYTLQNVRMDEAQVGIKISRRNINNLRYVDDTTLMAES